MPDVQTNPLSPAGKDPAEGAREPDKSPAPAAPLDGSHLGEAGDPVEGERKD
jgi:hypothetical protein